MDRLEPNVNFFPSVNNKRPNYGPNVKRDNGITLCPPSPDLREQEDPIEEDRKMEERKEEIALDDRAVAQASSQDAAIMMKKLDRLLDSKHAVIFRKLKTLEQKVARIDAVIQHGVKANDQYWMLDNWRDLKNYAAVAGMADRCYAMIFDAVDHNGGVLRDNGGTMRRKRPLPDSFDGEQRD